MGQRFQIIIKTPEEYWNEDNPNNTKGNLYVYHCQWMWGYFAIWRMGNLMKAIKELTDKKYRKKFWKDVINYKREVLDPALKWVCHKDLKRQNEIHSLYEEGFKFKDTETWFDLFDSLDNNNGIFFLEIDKNNKLKYFFFNPQTEINEGSNQGKILDWKTYLKDYEEENKEEWMKDKEFKDSVKIFRKTPLFKDLPDLKKWMYETGEKLR